MGKREDVATIVSDMKRHGFRQLRKVPHGWLYGMNEFRFQIPNGLADPGSIDQIAIDTCRREWEKKKAEVVGAYPGLKLKVVARLGREGAGRPLADVAQLEPVQNIEDVLTPETGGAGAGPEPVMLAPEGSTPSPSATETARTEPTVASGALEGSIPSGLPTPAAQADAPGPPHLPEDQHAMAKRKRAAYKGWDCPKCGKHFQTPGRHAKSCMGVSVDQTPDTAQRRARRNGHSTRHGPVKVVAAGDYAALVDAFQASSAALAEGFRALLTERDLYKQERDADAKILETLRGALTPRKG